MKITHLATHSSYGIKLWKSGMIALRTTTIALLWSTLALKMPGGHSHRWHVDKVLGPHVLIFFVCFKLLVSLWFVGRKFISLYIQNYLFIYFTLPCRTKPNNNEKTVGM